MMAHNLCYTTLLEKGTIDRLGLEKGVDYIQTPNNGWWMLWFGNTLELIIFARLLRDGFETERTATYRSRGLDWGTEAGKSGFKEGDRSIPACRPRRSPACAEGTIS